MLLLRHLLTSSSTSGYLLHSGLPPPILSFSSLFSLGRRRCANNRFFFQLFFFQLLFYFYFFFFFFTVGPVVVRPQRPSIIHQTIFQFIYFCCCCCCWALYSRWHRHHPLLHLSLASSSAHPPLHWVARAPSSGWMPHWLAIGCRQTPLLAPLFCRAARPLRSSLPARLQTSGTITSGRPSASASALPSNHLSTFSSAFNLRHRPSSAKPALASSAPITLALIALRLSLHFAFTLSLISLPFAA